MHHWIILLCQEKKSAYLVIEFLHSHHWNAITCLHASNSVKI